MENLMLFFYGIGESWSTLSADQFFSMFNFLGNAAEVTSPESIATTFDRPATRTFGQFFSLIQFFAATIFVALLAWYVTKKMASARLGGGRETCNLAVIETIGVGGQAVVRLVKAGDKYLLVGVTRERVTLLAEIDKDQIVEKPPVEFSNLNTPFGKVLSRFIQPKDGDGGKDE